MWQHRELPPWRLPDPHQFQPFLVARDPDVLGRGPYARLVEDSLTGLHRLPALFQRDQIQRFHCRMFVTSIITMSYSDLYLCTITIAMCSGPNSLNPIPPPLEQKLGRSEKGVK